MLRIKRERENKTPVGNAALGSTGSCTTSERKAGSTASSGTNRESSAGSGAVHPYGSAAVFPSLALKLQHPSAHPCTELQRPRVAAQPCNQRPQVQKQSLLLNRHRWQLHAPASSKGPASPRPNHHLSKQEFGF